MTVTTAAALTANFRSNKESMLDSGLRNAGTLPICETFDRAALDLILSDTNCTHVRIYLGYDENSKVRLVITGANSSGQDLFISATNPANNFDADCVVEDGARCPTNCPPTSALNS